MNRTRIAGIGSAVPKKLLTNADLEKLVQTSDEWITTRTGIKERHVVVEGEKFSDLCTKAADGALKRAHMKPEDLDTIIVGTISGDMPFPATACLVQKNLGATRASAFDLQAACVGFLYGLHVADGTSNRARRKVVSANWETRSASGCEPGRSAATQPCNASSKSVAASPGINTLVDISPFFTELVELTIFPTTVVAP